MTEFWFWPGVNFETVKINSIALIFSPVLYQDKTGNKKEKVEEFWKCHKPWFW